MKKLLYIINPVSGRKQAKRLLAEVVARFTDGGYLCTVLVTAKRGDATVFAAKYAGAFDVVVCSGGDGTFSETVAGLVGGGHSTPVGYIPAGSTNDFASCHYISPDILTAAGDILAGTPKTLDVGRLNSRYFTYLAAFGAFTNLSYTTPQTLKNQLGFTAYILDALKELQTLKSAHARFETETGAFEGDYIFGAISNSTSIAGAIDLTDEDVDMNDGVFEVMLVRAPASLPEVRAIAQAIRTQEYSDSMFVFTKARRLRVEGPTDMNWSLDGEFQPGSPVVEVENIHSALTMITNDARRDAPAVSPLKYRAKP